jgi:hypothetical protein
MINLDGTESIIKITTEANGQKMSLEFSSETDMEELRDKFAAIANFLTFHPETIREVLYAEPEKGNGDT